MELRGGIWGDAVWLGWLELRALNFAALIDYFWSTFGDARARWAGAAFDKSSAVYGHINENGRFIRKWPA